MKKFEKHKKIVNNLIYWTSNTVDYKDKEV